MERLIFDISVTAVGSSVNELLNSDGLLVIFEEGVPPELVEISVTHTHGELIEKVDVEDILCFGEDQYPVTSVGLIANENLRLLGHVIIMFDGSPLPALPGNIHVRCQVMPKIQIGTNMRLLKCS